MVSSGRSDRRNADPSGGYAEHVRVRGLVQGVGFRPALWRLAQAFGLRGWVGNDGAGVTAMLCGPPGAITACIDALRAAPPPLARIDAIERQPVPPPPDCRDFRIIDSRADTVQTGVVPDAATCRACLQEIFDPCARRYRYPFTNCTQCGPRLSIIEAIPYDRAATTMRAFPMCAACALEFNDPADRRFHAQAIACPACGPRLWLEPAIAGDALDAAHDLLLAGRILAIKALGGFHLACDATNAAAVARLRQAKHRDAKPFALMARDAAVVRGYAALSAAEEAALGSPAAPIVLLRALPGGRLDRVAPGLNTLGFMLPSTPLHHLLLHRLDRPLVMTSGNLADEPPCIANNDARRRLRGIADVFLLHDRGIARRVDDSLVQAAGGAMRVLRRARGFAPAPVPLPPGLRADTPGPASLLPARRGPGTRAVPSSSVLAMGGELKSAFALLREHDLVLSHHLGDLENAPSFADYTQAVTQYQRLFGHRPRAIAIDRHPDYRSAQHGRMLAAQQDLPVITVQHHHAHLAACLAENGVPHDTQAVLGIILDGLGWGSDNTIWGGEFLLGDYRDFRRVASLRPVPLPGGAAAVREPWRNAYAQIAASLGWPLFLAAYGDTELARFFAGKPIAVLQQMVTQGINAPLSSSCGRLFDAVAAAVGVCRDRVAYEGQAAMTLQACADAEEPETTANGYAFAITEAADGVRHLDPAPVWPALLRDIAAHTSPGRIAARFHTGLAAGLAAMVQSLGVTGPVALSGGVFQNARLLAQTVQYLRAAGYDVLTHRSIPANDGGLALGQAVVAAARLAAGDREG